MNDLKTIISNNIQAARRSMHDRGIKALIEWVREKLPEPGDSASLEDFDVEAARQGLDASGDSEVTGALLNAGFEYLRVEGVPYAIYRPL